VVELAVGTFRCGPGLPAVFGVDDRRVVMTLEFGFVAMLGLQIVEVLEEEQP